VRKAQWQVENPEKLKNGIILGRLLKIAVTAHASIEVFSFFKWLASTETQTW